MEIKSLLEHLRERKINLEKMINDHDAFISEYQGSSNVNMGCYRYNSEQLTILLASVPSIFSYHERFVHGKLNLPQQMVLNAVNTAQHPCRYMNAEKISSIILASSIVAGV